MSKKITVEEWINEAFSSLPDKPENSFTVREVVEKTGVSDRTIISRLGRLIQLGKLKKGKCLINGVAANYYIPVEFLENEPKRPNGRTATASNKETGKRTSQCTTGITTKKRR